MNTVVLPWVILPMCIVVVLLLAYWFLRTQSRKTVHKDKKHLLEKMRLLDTETDRLAIKLDHYLKSSSSFERIRYSATKFEEYFTTLYHIKNQILNKTAFECVEYSATEEEILSLSQNIESLLVIVDNVNVELDRVKRTELARYN